MKLLVPKQAVPNALRPVYKSSLYLYRVWSVSRLTRRSGHSSSSDQIGQWYSYGWHWRELGLISSNPTYPTSSESEIPRVDQNESINFVGSQRGIEIIRSMS